MKNYICGNYTYDQGERPSGADPSGTPTVLSAREQVKLYIENELKPDNVPEADMLCRKLKKVHLRNDEIKNIFDQARVFKEQHRIANVIQQVRDRSQEARV
jgi:hypothetical protein